MRLGGLDSLARSTRTGDSLRVVRRTRTKKSVERRASKVSANDVREHGITARSLLLDVREIVEAVHNLMVERILGVSESLGSTLASLLVAVGVDDRRRQSCGARGVGR